MTVYVAALAGAAIGAGLAFAIVAMLPPVGKPERYDARYRDRGLDA